MDCIDVSVMVMVVVMVMVTVMVMVVVMVMVLMVKISCFSLELPSVCSEDCVFLMSHTSLPYTAAVSHRSCVSLQLGLITDVSLKISIGLSCNCVVLLMEFIQAINAIVYLKQMPVIWVYK